MHNDILLLRSFTKILLTVITFLLFISMPLEHAVAQNTNDPPIFVPPEQTTAPDVNTRTNFQAMSSDLSSNLQALQVNLANLAAMNTQANQDALNSLGANYGTAPGLGSNLGSIISSIDVNQVADSDNALSHQVKSILTGDDFLKTLAATGSLPVSQRQEVGKNLSGMWGVADLNANLAQLNANIVGLTRTYGNLVALSNRDPAQLAAMQDLPQAVNSLDFLAQGDLKSLSTLGPSLASAKDNFGDFQKDGGLANVTKKDSGANAALGKAGDSMAAISDMTSGVNSSLGGTLSQKVVPADSSVAPKRRLRNR
jgi:hypothetical protein